MFTRFPRRRRFNQKKKYIIYIIIRLNYFFITVISQINRTIYLFTSAEYLNIHIYLVSIIL